MGSQVDLGQRRVGVCLSSGFFGYYAHCGFIAAVESLGVTPRAIAGCSAGALTGALWASGLTPSAIEEAVLSVGPFDLLDLPSLRQLFSGPFGAVGGVKMERTLERVLPVRRFEECAAPFAVTTFDLALAEAKTISEGSLAAAVRASASLPGMFAPAIVDGRPCWDGAVAEKAPLGFLAERDDVDTILICYLARPERALPPRSLIAGLRLALDRLVYDADRREAQRVRDLGLEVLVVAPEVTRCGPHRMHLGRRIIEEARRETLRILAEGDFGCGELS